MLTFDIKNTILTIVIITGLAACKKKDKLPENEPMPTTQNMHLRITTVANGSKLNFSDTYVTSTGAKFKIESHRYYISNISLVRDNGSEYVVKGKVLLVNSTIPDYDLGKVPVDSYIGIRFTIGLDSATNHKDPTTYNAGHPLAIQTPGIHWSWNSGYIFMMTEGSCDTTVNNTDMPNALGQFNHGMFYHIGTDVLVRRVDLKHHFHVTGETAYQLNINADLNVLLTNVDIKTQSKSHTMGSLPLATKIADNIPNMFTIVP